MKKGYTYLVQLEGLGKAYRIRGLGRVSKAKPSLASYPDFHPNRHSTERLVILFFVLHGSPSITGILAANRLFLGKIGSVDGGILVCGGENVELSLRLGTFLFFLWGKAERNKGG